MSEVVCTIGVMTTIQISCDDCSRRETETCEDCLVTHLCGPASATPTAVVLDLDEHRAMRRLADVGLVPEVRHTAW